jgi:hypothetical protein
MRRIITYRPAGDERAVVPMPTTRSKERIYLTELTQFLQHNPSALKKFAKREGLLRKASLGHRGSVEYVSPYGAMRLIAYARAIQGENYLRGQQFHEFREKDKLRKRAATHKQLAIAIPRA